MKTTRILFTMVAALFTSATYALADTNKPAISCIAFSERTGAVSGRVVTVDNIPLSEVTVYLTKDRLLWHSQKCRTDESGAFIFESCKEGEYAIAAGPPLTSKRIVVQAGTTTEIVLVMDCNPRRRITGKIVSSRRLEGATIVFVPLTPDISQLVWPPIIESSKINKHGEYEIRPLREGLYLVRIMPPEEDSVSGKTNATDYIWIETISSPEDLVSIDIKPECKLTGSLKDPCGIPINNATLFLSPSQSKIGFISKMNPSYFSIAQATDPNGVFTYPAILPGTYDILAFQSYYSDNTSPLGTQFMGKINIDDTDTFVEWKTSEAVQMNGSILFSEPDSAPLGLSGQVSYMMLLSEESSKLRTVMRHEYRILGISDPPGKFSPPVLYPKGQYKVFAITTLNSYSSFGHSMSLEENTSLDALLLKGGCIRVSLQGDSEDIAGKTIRVLNQQNEPVPRIYDPLLSYDYSLLPALVLPTCSEGITTIHNLPPGVYHLNVDGNVVDKDVIVESGKKTAVTLKWSELVPQTGRGR